MQKIMFNDRYGLTDAVIEGRKIMTRRLADPKQKYQGFKWWQPCLELGFGLYGLIEDDDWELIEPRYHLGEVVAVAQSYNEATREFPHMATTLVGHDILGSEPGCTNKMFVRADLMPHQIRITGIKCEQLQSISDDDCFREGIIESWYESTDTTTYGFADEKKATAVEFDTPREAFASLIDRVSGKGTWASNPWVVAYEFELVK